MPSSGVKPEPELTWDKTFCAQLSLFPRLHFVVFENAPIAAELLAALSREVNVPGRIFQAPALPFPSILALVEQSKFVSFKY